MKDITRIALWIGRRLLIALSLILYVMGAVSSALFIALSDSGNDAFALLLGIVFVGVGVFVVRAMMFWLEKEKTT